METGKYRGIALLKYITQLESTSQNFCASIFGGVCFHILIRLPLSHVGPSSLWVFSIRVVSHEMPPCRF